MPTCILDVLAPLTSLRGLSIDCTPLRSEGVGRLWDGYPAVLTRLTTLRVQGKVFLGAQLELFLCEHNAWSSPPVWDQKTLSLTAERAKELRAALIAKYMKARGEFARSERAFNAGSISKYPVWPNVTDVKSC